MVEQQPSKDFTTDAEERNPSMVITALSVAFALEYMDNGCIFEAFL